jgi:hypothetical protein
VARSGSGRPRRMRCRYHPGVVLATQTPGTIAAERHPGSPSWARWVAALVAVVIGIALGALGTLLVAPGKSLAVPTAIVAAVGGGIALVAWVVASFRSSRQAGWIFAVGVVVVTVLACLWTFEYALPAAIAWSDATTQAQNEFSSLQQAAHGSHGTLPPQPCTVHGGSVGPLPGPYKECVVWTPVGHAVSFVASGPNASGGLVYTDTPSAFFADECERHLVGRWWMFAASTNSNGDPGSCSFGYRFHGGP